MCIYIYIYILCGQIQKPPTPYFPELLGGVLTTILWCSEAFWTGEINQKQLYKEIVKSLAKTTKIVTSVRNHVFMDLATYCLFVSLSVFLTTTTTTTTVLRRNKKDEKGGRMKKERHQTPKNR